MPWNSYSRISDLDLNNFADYKRWRNSNTYVMDTFRNFHGDILGYPGTNGFENIGNGYYDRDYWMRPPLRKYRSQSPQWRHEKDAPVKNFGTSNRSKTKYHETRNFYPRNKRQENENYKESTVNSYEDIYKRNERYDSDLPDRMVRRYTPSPVEPQDFHQPQRRPGSDIIQERHEYDLEMAKRDNAGSILPQSHPCENGSSSSLHAADIHSMHKLVGNSLISNCDNKSVTFSNSDHLLRKTTQKSTMFTCSSSSGLTSHSSSPDNAEQSSSWYCTEEQEQIVEMLREVDLRHERQLVHDMLVLKGDISRSDDSFNSDAACCGDCHQRSMSSEEEEDGVIILLPALKTPQSQSQQGLVEKPSTPNEAKTDVLQYIDNELLERAKSDYLKDGFHGYFYDSPNKIIVENKEKSRGSSRVPPIKGEARELKALSISACSNGSKTSPKEILSRDTKKVLNIKTAATESISHNEVDSVTDDGLTPRFSPKTQSSPKFNVQQADQKVNVQSTPPEKSESYFSPKASLSPKLKAQDVDPKMKPQSKALKKTVRDNSGNLGGPKNTARVFSNQNLDKKKSQKCNEDINKTLEIEKSSTAACYNTEENQKSKAKDKSKLIVGSDNLLDTPKLSTDKNSHNSVKYDSSCLKEGVSKFSETSQASTKIASISKNNYKNSGGKKYPQPFLSNKNNSSPKQFLKEENLHESQNKKSVTESKVVSECLACARRKGSHKGASLNDQKNLVNDLVTDELNNTSIQDIDIQGFSGRTCIFNEETNSKYKRVNLSEIFGNHPSGAPVPETQGSRKEPLLGLFNHLESEKKHEVREKMIQCTSIDKLFQKPAAESNEDSLKRLLNIGLNDNSQTGNEEHLHRTASEHLKQLLGISSVEETTRKSVPSVDVTSKFKRKSESHEPLYTWKYSPSSEKTPPHCNGSFDSATSSVSPYSGSISLPSVSYESSSEESPNMQCLSAVERKSQKVSENTQQSQPFLKGTLTAKGYGENKTDSDFQSVGKIETGHILKGSDTSVLSKNNLQYQNVSTKYNGKMTEKVPEELKINEANFPHQYGNRKKNKSNLKNSNFGVKNQFSNENNVKSLVISTTAEKSFDKGQGEDSNNPVTRVQSATKKKKKYKKKQKFTESALIIEKELVDSSAVKIASQTEKCLHKSESEQKSIPKDKIAKKNQEGFTKKKNLTSNNKTREMEAFKAKTPQVTKEIKPKSKPLKTQNTQEEEKQYVLRDSQITKDYNKRGGRADKLISDIPKGKRTTNISEPEQVDSRNKISDVTKSLNVILCDQSSTKHEKVRDAKLGESDSKKQNKKGFQSKLSKRREDNRNSNPATTKQFNHNQSLNSNSINEKKTNDFSENKSIAHSLNYSIKDTVSDCYDEKGKVSKSVSFKKDKTEGTKSEMFRHQEKKPCEYEIAKSRKKFRDVSKEKDMLRDRPKCYSSCELTRSTMRSLEMGVCPCNRKNFRKTGLTLSLKQAQMERFLKEDIRNDFKKGCSKNCQTSDKMSQPVIINHCDDDKTCKSIDLSGNSTIQSKARNSEPKSIDPMQINRSTQGSDKIESFVQNKAKPVTLALVSRKGLFGNFNATYPDIGIIANSKYHLSSPVKINTLFPTLRRAKPIYFSPISIQGFPLHPLIWQKRALDYSSFRQNLTHGVCSSNALANVSLNRQMQSSDQRIVKKSFSPHIAEVSSTVKNWVPKKLSQKITGTKFPASQRKISEEKLSRKEENSCGRRKRNSEDASALRSENSQAPNTRTLSNGEVDGMVDLVMAELENIYAVNGPQWMSSSKRYSV